MFVAEEITLGVGYAVAAERLPDAIGGKALHSASDTAYQHGLDTVIRVGPFGGLGPLSKLVRVHVLPPIPHEATMWVGLRWEAVGRAGDLFPALDADLILAPDGEDRSQLKLVGSYRPPLGRIGAALDRTMLHGVAQATIRALLVEVADLIVRDTGHRPAGPVAAAIDDT